MVAQVQYAPYPVLVADLDGTVHACNGATERLAGSALGKKCWNVLPTLVEATDLPCREGCVGRLIEDGIEFPRASDIKIGGRRHELTCVPVGERVVCQVLSREVPTPPPDAPVTRRELQILRGLAEGMTTEELAQELAVSSATVRSHVQNLRHKFDAKTRAAVVARAMRLGLLP